MFKLADAIRAANDKHNAATGIVDNIFDGDLPGYGATGLGSKRPSMFDNHATYQRTSEGNGNGVNPNQHSTMSVKGCPATAPPRARGFCPVGYKNRIGRNQATGLFTRIHGVKPSERPSSALKFGADYQAQQDPNKAHRDAVQRIRESSSDSAKKRAAAAATPSTTPAGSKLPPSAAPAPAASPETPTTGAPTTDIQPSGSSKAPWLLGGFLFVGLIAAAVYLWYQRRFGKRPKRGRKPRSWEMVRMNSCQERGSQGHSHYRHSRGANSRALEEGKFSRQGTLRYSMERQDTLRSRPSPRVMDRFDNADPLLSPPLSHQNSVSYVEVARSSHEPSWVERVSKGGKLN
jgi:hypothetical protein